jgi:eukaryotic-like serine/threonine-protein kinase
MDAARWATVEAAFHALADRPAVEQARALTELTAFDAALADAVRAMLDADQDARTLLDLTPGTLAHSLLDGAGDVPQSAFGPYRLTAVLGEGGMGVVYLATRDDLNARAAIKVLRDAWLSPGRRDRFLTEQRTLASLNHPGIARLLDADRLSDGTPWFAMEYVEGEPITGWAAQRALSIPERLALFRQACEAVRYAHERGVIHRDIKPANVLVSESGAVKLLDFGIAKSTSGADETIDATHSRSRMLTPAYAAPEQLRGESVGVQADVYALGVLLFELLTAQRPYDVEGLTTSEAAARIVSQTAPRVSSLRRAGAPSALASGGARADLDALVACALQPDQTRRYRSVDALVQDLDRFQRRQPISAQPDSLQYRVRRLLERRWREAAVAAVIVSVGLGGAISYTTGLSRARRAAEAETARVSRMRDFLISLFDGGDEEAGPSNALRVTDIIATGIRESRAITTDPRLQADLFGVLGYATGQLGNPAQADTLLRASLDMKRRLYGSSSRDAIEAHVMRARQELSVGHTDSALTALRQAYQLASTALASTEPVRAMTAEAFGAALAVADSTEAALPLLQEAVRLRAGIDTASVAYANAISALADGHYYAEQFAVADTLNRDVIARISRLLGDDHPSLANNYVNLGEIALRDGRYADAEQHARHALALCERYFGPEHTRTAGALKNVGAALEALPLLRRALAVQERTLGPDASPVATTLNSLAAAEFSTGNPDAGIAMYIRSTRIFEKMYGPSHPHALVARANLASTLLRMQRVDTAATVLADVVRIAATSLAEDHQDLAVFRIRLGRARLAQKRYRDVITESMRGLQSLEASTSEPTSFSRAARKDLREAYLALGDSVGAARFADPDGRLTPRALPAPMVASPR